MLPSQFCEDKHCHDPTKKESFSKVQISLASYVSASAKVVYTHLSKSEFCGSRYYGCHDNPVTESMCDDDNSLTGISPKDEIVTPNSCSF